MVTQRVKKNVIFYVVLVGGAIVLLLSRNSFRSPAAVEAVRHDRHAQGWSSNRNLLDRMTNRQTGIPVNTKQKDWQQLGNDYPRLGDRGQFPAPKGNVYADTGLKFQPKADASDQHRPMSTQHSLSDYTATTKLMNKQDTAGTSLGTAPTRKSQFGLIHHGQNDGQPGPIGGQPGQIGGQPGPIGGQQGPIDGQQGPIDGQQGPIGGQPEPIGGQPGPIGGQPGPIGDQSVQISATHLKDMKFYDGSGQLVTSQPNWIVVTSIQKPTTDIIALSRVPEWKLVVIGDTKTPTNWKCPNVVYLDVEQQKTLGLKILDYIPYKSYARKNIGYFFAIAHGAKLIYDTDDDNQPNDGFRSFNLEDGENTTVLVVKNFIKTYNPYPHFGQHSMWPRGFPLDDIANTQPREYLLCEMTTPYLRQGVVNGDPDVDAIYRLLRKHTSKRLNVLFDVQAPRVVLPPNVFAPYNSQNTISNYEAFWGLAFPVTPTLRVCDIWRSYWAQRLMWLIGGQIGFYTAGTFQYRSAHSYLKDFVDEEQLYHQSTSFVDFLHTWKCRKSDFFECIKDMSVEMANKGFWDTKDALFIDAFLQDLTAVGYTPPMMNPVSQQKCQTTPTNVIYYPQEQAASYGVVPDYYLPPFDLRKFNILANIVKANCTKRTIQSSRISLNGSSLINDILLIIHLDMPPSEILLSHLELFYRPRFGQILYCGRWYEQSKQVFHTMKASFAEIDDQGDAQMACLYKAADMHYIVDGYLVIHYRALINVPKIIKHKNRIWMSSDWVHRGPCREASCVNHVTNIAQVSIAIGTSTSDRPIASCNINRPGMSFSYSKQKVFFVPSTYNKELRSASKMRLDGLSMAAWLYCINSNPISLQGATNFSTVSTETDYLKTFDFNLMTSICPVLGYYP